VVYLGEAELLSYLGRPAFDRPSFDLLRATAFLAHKVMVMVLTRMRFTAEPVCRLAFGGVNNIREAVFGERL
jgi:hypothetical protein